MGKRQQKKERKEGGGQELAMHMPMCTWPGPGRAPKEGMIDASGNKFWVVGGTGLGFYSIFFSIIFF